MKIQVSKNWDFNLNNSWDDDRNEFKKNIFNILGNIINFVLLSKTFENLLTTGTVQNSY